MEENNKKTIRTSDGVGTKTNNRVETSGNKIVQTFAEDMAEVIENDKSGGLIKKIIHEEEAHEIEKKSSSPGSIKNKFFMFIGLLFISLGLITLSFFKLKKEVPTVPVVAQFIPLIFSDASSSIDIAPLNKDAIIQNVYNAVNLTKVKKGGLEGIYLTENKQIIGLRKFIKLIEGSFIPPNNTVLVNDDFLMGVVNGETKDFFILLKMRSTADIFDALRAWEKKMFFDLHGFFGYALSTETKYLENKEFQDGIMENKNTRVLYDSNNQIVMMYIFVDDNSVVITNTESAAREVMLRLAASRVGK
ncbi:MAG TPA: hypothetical protein VK675_04470 [Candidatus Paceibacterota bacterium]|nr:hypothetical protein [Candidatus Paceibacterota bacterium]